MGARASAGALSLRLGGGELPPSDRMHDPAESEWIDRNAEQFSVGVDKSREITAI
jgi:hypothetical protein